MSWLLLSFVFDVRLRSWPLEFQSSFFYNMLASCNSLFSMATSDNRARLLWFFIYPEDHYGDFVVVLSPYLTRITWKPTLFSSWPRGARLHIFSHAGKLLIAPFLFTPPIFWFFPIDLISFLLIPMNNIITSRVRCFLVSQMNHELDKS